jgi:hypothetical protein
MHFITILLGFKHRVDELMVGGRNKKQNTELQIHLSLFQYSRESEKFEFKDVYIGLQQKYITRNELALKLAHENWDFL